MSRNSQIKSVALPENSLLHNSLLKIHFSDCYNSIIKYHEPLFVDQALVLFFYSIPEWAIKLIASIHFILKLLGRNIQPFPTDKEKIRKFNPEVGQAIGLFKVYYKNENEIIIGYDDIYLSFRNSVLIKRSAHAKIVGITFSTVVQYTTFWGKLYFVIAKPFHKIIVLSTFKVFLKNFSMV